MKIALLGVGKTGAKVLEQYPSASVFNSKNLPSVAALREHDIIISFLPGDTFTTYIPMLLETARPVVTGSTGFEWPKNLNFKAPWIHATNFSLGMNVVKQMILVAKKAEQLFSQANFHIHEIHHTKKLDAPSGTALSWREWLGVDCDITSAREGDVVGIHELTIDTPNEEIFLRHHAKDRGIFAAGALWAANYIMTNKNLETGLHQFSEIIQKELT